MSLKIFKNWNSFHNDIESIKSNLVKSAYPPPFLINKVIKKYLHSRFSSKQNYGWINDLSNPGGKWERGKVVHKHLY